MKPSLKGDLICYALVVLVSFTCVTVTLFAYNMTCQSPKPTIHYKDHVEVVSGFYTGQTGHVVDDSRNGEILVRFNEEFRSVYINPKFLVRIDKNAE